MKLKLLIPILLCVMASGCNYKYDYHTEMKYYEAGFSSGFIAAQKQARASCHSTVIGDTAILIIHDYGNYDTLKTMDSVSMLKYLTQP